MVRPLRVRKINNPPKISGMKPYLNKLTSEYVGSVFLFLEEYESLRLCDHEMLNHFQAAALMNVSRPTITRIYARARKKVAEALVLGKQIIIEGGKIYFDSEWFSCHECGCNFNNPDKRDDKVKCPLCGSSKVSDYNDVFSENNENTAGYPAMCICPACRFEKLHHFGHPCKEEVCPECGLQLVRKGINQSKSI